MQNIWLFKFTYYTYCQGTRDNREGLRLLHLSLPCEENEAKKYLIEKLNDESLVFDENTIENLSYKITNS